MHAAAVTGGIAALGFQSAEEASAAEPADALPVRKKVLSEPERANLRTLGRWVENWSLPGGSVEALLRDVYAPQPAIFFPLQGQWLIYPGGDTSTFEFVESRLAGAVRSRKVVLRTVYPAHSIIALEATLEAIWSSGEVFRFPMSSLLTFDGAGRITEQRTYNDLGRMFPADEKLARSRAGWRLVPA